MIAAIIKIFDAVSRFKVTRLLRNASKEQIELYLSQSVSLEDLERRQRDLQRRGIL